MAPILRLAKEILWGVEAQDRGSRVPIISMDKATVLEKAAFLQHRIAWRLEMLQIDLIMSTQFAILLNHSCMGSKATIKINKLPFKVWVLAKHSRKRPHQNKLSKILKIY